ncbi:hypothetical protein MCOR25_011049 [Pyricularia grisea]|nr:hypothetical protein MCOR25_011049 [Pyricularia grisea]
MEELLSTFLVAHLFRDFPEFYKGIMQDLAELPVKGQHNLKFNYESSQGWPEASTDNDIRSAQLPDSTATTLPVSFPNPSAYPLTILPAPGDPIDSSTGSRAVAQALYAGQEPSPDGWTTDTAEEQFPDQRSQGLGRWKRRRTLEPAVQYTSPSLPSLSTYATTQPHTSPHDVFTNASTRATGYVANPSQPTSDGYNVSGYPTISPQSIASTRLVSTSFIDETQIPLQQRRTSINGELIVKPSCLVNMHPVQPNANESVTRWLDPYSLSAPQPLLVFEELLYNTKLYFQNSCCGMSFDKDGNLLNSTGAKWDNSLCSDFDSHCLTATILAKKKMKFVPILSKAFSLVEGIVRAEHPRTLACFLEVFIHLIQTNNHQVASCLRRYIGEISKTITTTDHPWRQICWLLGQQDLTSEAMAQIWQCMTDTFDNNLGPLSRFAVSVRLDYTKRVADPTEEEQVLRHLLDRLCSPDLPTPNLSTPRVMLNLAHNLRKQGNYSEAEKLAEKIRLLLDRYQIYACRTVERIESLKVASYCQFDRGDVTAAAKTMQEAIQMIEDKLGNTHSWVTEFKTVLEGWLRAADKVVDADNLQREIDKLMKKDLTEEDLTELN